jgi:DNA-nicking Smr family endonuclease
MRGPSRKMPRLKDWHLWTEVTRTVSPLHPDRLAREVAEAPPPPASFLNNEAPVKRKTALPANGHAVALPMPRSNAQNPDKIIEPRLTRKLRRGRLPIDASVDLHGLRQDEAHGVLCRFIASRYARGDRTLLVITGMGLKKTGWGQIEQKGVLRGMLPLWLSEKTLAPMVAGWQGAAREHGGEGAFYVRLKRHAP